MTPPAINTVRKVSAQYHFDTKPHKAVIWDVKLPLI